MRSLTFLGKCLVFCLFVGLIVPWPANGDHHLLWQKAAQQADQLMALAEPPIGKSYFLAAEQLYLGAIETAVQAQVSDKELADLYLRLAENRTSLGKSELAIKNLERALALAESSVPASSPELCTYLNELGNAIHPIGRHSESRSLFIRCLENRREALGETDLAVAESLILLGASDQLLGEPEEAAHKFRQALRIRESQLPEDHELVSEARNNLKVVMDEAGNN